MVKKDILRAHFSKFDPVLFSYFDRVATGITITKSKTPFIDLIESIISQQLSEKAASTICSRFYTLFNTPTISSGQILSLKDQALRSVGISWSKVSYIKAIASAVDAGEIDFHMLKTLENEEVIKELTKIKGIGRWTAEMFLMFSLGREDVFSYGDLGLRRAIMNVYGLEKDPTVVQMKQLEKKWMPYRTFASRLLWRIGDLK